MRQKRGLIWFKNDLRLHDNEVVLKAVATCEAVLPIFIINPAWASASFYGFKKTGVYRLRFIYESVVALQQQLQAIGSNLHIYIGAPEKLIPELIIKHQITDIFTKEEFGPDEQGIEKKVSALGNMFRVNYHKLNNYSCLTRETLATMTDDSFKDFCKKAANKDIYRKTFDAITNIKTLEVADNTDCDIFGKYINLEDDAQKEFLFKGGESEALKRLNDFIWNTNNIDHTTEIKSFNNTNYSAKFSPYLSQGCLSPSLVIESIDQYETEKGQNEGTKALRRDMLWREYYLAMFLKYGAKFFRQGGVFNKPMICLPNYEALNKWIAGTTGEPIVDASMKEFAKTGFLNSSGRSIAANYLSKKMLVDWRLGAAYFESQLVDYDVCLNYGNWANVIGVGPDESINPNLNPTEVAEKLDPSGAYRKTWLR